MLQKLTTFFLFVILTANCYSQTLTVAAASNTRYALEEIARVYRAETACKLNLVFASSGKLSSQIINGAPYDIFLSANKAFADTLFKKDLTLQQPIELIKASLVIVSNKDIELGSDNYSLLENDLKSIAIANPKIAPYGIASMEMLRNLNLDEKIEDKLIVVESISQVNQHIHIGSVDAGLTSKSIIKANRLNENINWLEVDTSLYRPIIQYVVLLKSKDEMHKTVSQFVEFLFSKKAQEIFYMFGYYRCN